MHASLVRRQLGGLIPPKIATPSLVVGRRLLYQPLFVPTLIDLVFSLEGLVLVLHRS